MSDYFKKVLRATQKLTGPNKWERIGKSVYRCRDSYVWKEKEGWYRTDLPPFTMRAALASVAMSPLGMFSKTYGPYPTMKRAKRR